ncbi:MAG: OmpA family protein [Betaproteobacteria bacterium]
MNIPLRTTLVVAAAALAAGCATTSQIPAPLQEARDAYSTAQAKPHVPRFASAELNQAGRALNEAERSWRQDADEDIAAHQAYLAEQRAHIAVNVANARTARAEIDQADAERRAVVAEARRLEAQEESRQAQDARQQTAEDLARAKQARADAEQARQSAEQAVSRLKEQLQDLKAERTDRGWVLRLGSEVLFDVGEATLKPGARRAIDSLAQFLRDYPDQQVSIEGFTDNTGSSDFNLALSQRRAQAVKQAIAAAGIDPGRIEARGYGESFPVASNDTTAGRQLNRRVEVLLPETQDGGDASAVRK